MPHSVSSAASASRTPELPCCFLGYVIIIDPTKVSCVASALLPDSRKQMQHFMRFAKFYCQFICDYSDITAPLTALTCNKVLVDSGHRRGFSVP